MQNVDIAEILERIALLLGLIGESDFKIRIYQKAAEEIYAYQGKVADMLLAGQKPKIAGLGASTWALVTDIINNKKPQILVELEQTVPNGVVELTNLSGIGVKTAQNLWQNAQIISVEQLYDACITGKLASIKGFGAKTVQTLKGAIEHYNEGKKKLLLKEAFRTLENEQKILANESWKINLFATGEVRRNCPTITTLAYLVSTHDVTNAQNFYINRGFEISKLNSAPFPLWEAKSEIGYHTPFTVYLCEEIWQENALFFTTGVQEHNVIFDGYLTQPKKEIDIYASHGLPYIAPELRENRGEIALATENKLPKLIELGDLKGVLHAHSTYSDGMHSLKDMAIACQKMGYEYFGITDHSKTAAYAGGLLPETVQKQWLEIERLNKELAPFKIFKGIESDILPDGSLDYAPEILSGFDFIIASVHLNLKMDETTATTRLIKAIENPYTTIMGHLTGRLLLSRSGYPVNHSKIIDACAANGVAIEINANPYRLDIDWTWVEYAQNKGVKLAICPDAHSIDGIYDMFWGISVGRKGYLTAENTINTFSAEQIQAYFTNKHRLK